MFYVINMPAELFMDGYVSYYNGRKEKSKLKKDRFLRSSLILLFAALEGELNRQLNITTYPDRHDIKKKLQRVLMSKYINPSDQKILLNEMDVSNQNSFRSVRNGVAHFKGNYSLYGITENNIDRYFDFTKKVFELIHGQKVIKEWLIKAEESL